MRQVSTQSTPSTSNQHVSTTDVQKRETTFADDFNATGVPLDPKEPFATIPKASLVSTNCSSETPMAAPLEPVRCENENKPNVVPHTSAADEVSSGSSTTTTTTGNQDAANHDLRDRVQDLETKLAVLSRLLQQQSTLQPKTEEPLVVVTQQSSPPPSPPSLTTAEETSEVLKRQRLRSSSISSTPHLESPAPLSRKSYIDIQSSLGEQVHVNLSSELRPRSRSLHFEALESLVRPPDLPTKNTPPKPPHPRKLSFRVLYDEDNTKETTKSDDQGGSMTLSERLWLGPALLSHFQHPQRLQERLAAETNDTATVRTKWLDHLNSFQESTPDVDVQMEEFIKVPGRVEILMLFGSLICVDSFLYMITILPVRFVWSLLLLILNIVGRRWQHSSPFSFHRRHWYQIIQVTILYTIYRYVLWSISLGKLYHWIRGQTMLKLYFLVAMVEIFDRMLSSLGQDCLESMYWNTVHRPRSSRMVISVGVVGLYAAVHSLLLFVHVVTLHVAMNSTDQVLLSLLISGNFAEIKSTVFKKYNKAALFKIAASDICERFKLALFLSLILFLNVCQGVEDMEQYLEYARVWMVVAGAEMLADWIKHAFITKFNFLPAGVYPEYALLLAGDVTGIGHEGVNLDHSHAVVKRIGFAQIPLVCVFFRLIREAGIKYSMYHPSTENGTTSQWVLVIPVWLFLMTVKFMTGRLVHGMALRKLYAAPEFSSRSKDGGTRMTTKEKKTS